MKSVATTQSLPVQSKGFGRYWLPVLLFAAMALLYSVDASAVPGGLTKAKTEAVEWDKAIYALVGVLASIYLVLRGLYLWRNAGTWGDFGESCVKVALVGAAPTLAAAAWAFFSS